MWKRGGRSSALDRAQALLSAQRSSRGDVDSVQGSTGKTRRQTGALGGSVKTRSAPPNTLLSDLSDLSSVSSNNEHGAETAGKTQGREGDSAKGNTESQTTITPTLSPRDNMESPISRQAFRSQFGKDVRPQSSLGGGGGSRFLKKAPPPATNSSHFVSNSQVEQVPVSRKVSSSLRGSKAAALSRLAQIESRVHSRMQAGRQQKPAECFTSDEGLSPPPAAVSQSASARLSPQTSGAQNLKEKRFLKSNTTVARNNSNDAACRSPQDRDVGARRRSRAADAAVPSAGSERKSAGVVTLESDEEDMRKLLGESFDSMDNSFLTCGRPSSRKTTDKMPHRSSEKVCSTPPPTAGLPSSSSVTTPSRSPASPSHRSSPFRFTGQARAHFSPSVLSRSQSPHCVSTAPQGRPTSPHRSASPQCSLSSMSGRGEVLSLEELFPVGSVSEDLHSVMSAVSSEDFQINVMTLDDLAPADLTVTEETPEKEREAKLGAPVPASQNKPQLLGLKEEDEEQEDVPDYQSDFESECRTEMEDSAGQVSEDLQEHGDEEEASDASRWRPQDDHPNSFSDTARSYTSSTSERSQTASRGRDSESSRSHGSQTFSGHSWRRVLKEAAVQTQPDPLVYMWPTGPAVGYVDPAPVVTHTLSAETVEALRTCNPAAFALNELLKQQLAMTRRFIESSRRLHASLVQSLEPPNYRYTRLEDTKEYIRNHRPPKLTMEEALEEVLQEMRDY